MARAITAVKQTAALRVVLKIRIVAPGQARSVAVIDAFHDGPDEISRVYRRISEAAPAVAEHTGKARRAG
jgi:hypothetical protein